MDRIVVPIFARLQKSIREKPAILKITSVHPQLRTFLQEMGILRTEELTNNLAEALQTISQTKVN